MGDGKGNTVGTVGELLIADFTGSSQNAVVENPAAQIAVVPAFGRGHHFGKRIGCIDRHLQRVGVESPLQRLAIELVDLFNGIASIFKDRRIGVGDGVFDMA